MNGNPSAGSTGMKLQWWVVLGCGVEIWSKLSHTVHGDQHPWPCAKGRDRIHYRTVSISGMMMTLFIVLQNMYPLLPFYSVGLMVSTCLVHVFIEEDERLDMDRKLHSVERKAELERKMNEKARQEKILIIKKVL